MDKKRLLELAGMTEGFEEDSLLSLSVADRKQLKRLVIDWIELVELTDDMGEPAPKDLVTFAIKLRKRL